MKILIIEDDQRAAALLKGWLDFDNEVANAFSGEEAIHIAKEFKPELIISDWQLNSGMDGVGACTEIFSNQKAIVIFVSGSPLEQLRELAGALEPLKIMAKPINLDDLSDLIGTLK